MKQTPLVRKTGLRPVGKRGKRLAKGDRAITKKAKGEVCERCQATPADPHHLISRRDSVIRHEPLNIVHLCREHHRMAHDDPAEFEAWLEEKWPGRLETCRVLSVQRSKSNIGGQE